MVGQPDSPINSRQLHIFATLVRCRSFTAAARELGVTQSAVSHAIGVLETDLDCRLMDRTHRGVRLTASGEMLLRRTAEILGLMQAARAEVVRQRVG